MEFIEVDPLFSELLFIESELSDKISIDDILSEEMSRPWLQVDVPSTHGAKIVSPNPSPSPRSKDSNLMSTLDFYSAAASPPSNEYHNLITGGRDQQAYVNELQEELQLVRVQNARDRLAWQAMWTIMTMAPMPSDMISYLVSLTAMCFVEADQACNEFINRSHNSSPRLLSSNDSVQPPSSAPMTHDRLSALMHLTDVPAAHVQLRPYLQQVATVSPGTTVRHLANNSN